MRAFGYRRIDMAIMPTQLMRMGIGSAILIAAVAGCSGVVEPKDVGAENTPAIEFNGGQFVFAVRARNWTFNRAYQPDNLYSIDGGGGLDVGMAITGYSGGAGLVTVTDGNNAVVFNQTLVGNLPDGT